MQSQYKIKVYEADRWIISNNFLYLLLTTNKQQHYKYLSFFLTSLYIENCRPKKSQGEYTKLHLRQFVTFCCRIILMDFKSRLYIKQLREMR
ncbi:CLUMA_CG004843, isoform A [Clunio marinus]|uniref:CLUMA_CG004843, isoform A n=1 Tax=Clunio marinus TaxID=568069 RepID=A0A1J1HXA7_9DIPT|nr:CLUMA_CG004843, isoform A [Clunio marinus]